MPPEDARRILVLSEVEDAVFIEERRVPFDQLKDAFAAIPTGEVRLEAPASAAWERVIAVLDRMKQAGHGDRPFVLAVRGDRSRRTASLRLPSVRELVAPAPRGANDASAPGAAPEVELVSVHTVSVAADGTLRVDGAELAGPLADALSRAAPGGLEKVHFVVQGDARAAFGAVLDATTTAQRQGARVAFGVAGVAAAPAPAPRDKPRARTDTWNTCPFPRRADAAGIDDAVVVVRVKVDASGKVESVAVVSDPGHGFGEAARTCAKKAPFDPALDPSGKPIAGELTMRIRFAR